MTIQAAKLTEAIRLLTKALKVLTDAAEEKGIDPNMTYVPYDRFRTVVAKLKSAHEQLDKLRKSDKSQGQG